jgi:hypothetical protein
MSLNVAPCFLPVQHQGLFSLIIIPIDILFVSCNLQFMQFVISYLIMKFSEVYYYLLIWCILVSHRSALPVIVLCTDVGTLFESPRRLAVCDCDILVVLMCFSWWIQSRAWFPFQACGFPQYMKGVLFTFAGGERNGHVTLQNFLAAWRKWVRFTPQAKHWKFRSNYDVHAPQI